MLTTGPPVCGNHALESPFSAKDVFQKLFIFRSSVTVDHVVGAHDRPRIGFFYDNFKLFQINLTKGTFGYTGIAVLSVCLFVIGGKMFYGSADMLRLDTTYHTCCHLTCKQRIFGIILEVSSAQRISVNVDSGCQPYGDIIFFHFFCSGCTYLFYQIRVPGVGKKSCAWPCSCTHATFRCDTKTCRSVGCHNVRYTVIRQVTETKGIGHTGIWLTSKQFDQIIVGKLAHELVQSDLSFCYFDKRFYAFFYYIEYQALLAETYFRQDAFVSSRNHFFKCAGIGIISFSLRQFLVGSVGKHSLRQT